MQTPCPSTSTVSSPCTPLLPRGNSDVSAETDDSDSLTIGVDKSLEGSIVLVVVGAAFVIAYYVVVTSDNPERVKYFPLLHLVCPPLTLQRYPTAETSTLLHFVGLMASVSMTCYFIVFEVYSRNPIHGFVYGVLAVAVIMCADVAFHGLLQRLGCDEGNYGRFRKEHGVLGIGFLLQFITALYQRILLLIKGRKVSAAVSGAPAEASGSPPPYVQHSDFDLCNRSTTPAPQKMVIMMRPGPTDSPV